MKCIYKLNGRIFESELALENYLLSNKKYYSKYGDVVYEMTEALNVVYDKLGKVSKDYGTVVEPPVTHFDGEEIKYYNKPNIGVTEFLAGLTRNGRLLFPEFRTQEYWDRRKLAWKKGDFNEDELALFFDDHANAKPITENFEKYKEMIEKKWRLQGYIGTATHAVMEAYFSFCKDGVSPTLDLIKLKSEELIRGNVLKVAKAKDNLEYEDLIPNPEVINKLFETAQTLEKNLKLQYGEKSLFFPEFKILGKLNQIIEDKGYILRGCIDLLVVGEDGKLHILDYKTSPKDYNSLEYSNVKRYTYSHQLGTYNRILGQYGLDHASSTMKIVPLLIMNFRPTEKGTYTYDIINPNRPDDIFDDITHLILDTKVNDNLMLFIDVDMSNYTVETSDVVEEVNVAMTEMFPGHSYVKDYSDDIILDILKRRKALTPNENNELVFKWTDLSKNEIVAKSKEELVAKLREELSKRNEKRVTRTINLINLLKEGIKTGSSDLNFPTSLDGDTRHWFQKNLDKYCNDLHEIVEEDVLILYGIIGIKNSVNNVIDFIRITSEVLDEVQHFQENTNGLTGAFESDATALAKQNNLMLKAYNGNIEAIETMLVLNATKGTITLNNVIGKILVANPYAGYGMEASNEELLYCFNELTRFDRVKNAIKSNNFKSGKIKFASKFEKALSDFRTILERGTKTEWSEHKKFKNYSSAELMKVQYDSPEALYKELDNLRRKMELDYKMLANLQDVLTNPELMNEDYVALYNAVLIAMADLKNIDFRQQVEQHDKWLESAMIHRNGVTGTYIDNPGNLSSDTLNLMTKLVTQAYQNVRQDMIEPTAEYKRLVDELKKEKGFNTLKEHTVGNQTSLYSNMWEHTPNGDFKVKHINDKSLTTAERNFLIYFLERINKNRFKNKQPEELAKMRDSGDYEYYKVPLQKGDASTVAAVNGMMDSIKDVLKSWKPEEAWRRTKQKLQGLYAEEKTTKSKQQLFEMTNMFDSSEDAYKREKMLENGLDYFEHNLETIGLKHELAYSLKRHVDAIMPMIKATAIHLSVQGGIKNETFKEDLLYVEDYINSVLKNKSIMKETAEKFAKYGNLLKKAASICTLAISPVLGIYLTIQGLWLDIALMLEDPQYTEDGKPVFTFLNMKKGFLTVYRDLFRASTTPTVSSGLNDLYGLNDRDMNTYAENVKSDRFGVWNFSNFLFKFASRPDYYNRLTIFLAQMESDGTLDAHSINSKGVLEYDIKKDKRFTAFINGDTNHLDYNKLKSLYITLAKQFMLENAVNPDGTTFLMDLSNPTLPRAYTNQLAESMKSLADNIYGYYTHEKKSMVHATLIGTMWMQFKTYWSGKKNQYLAQGGVKLLGKMVLLKENGKQMYYKVDPDTGLPTDEITEEVTSMPVYVWLGDWLEGIGLTVVSLIHDMGWNPKHWKEAVDKYWNNPDENLRNIYRYNLRKLWYDSTMFMFVAPITAGLMANWYDEVDDESDDDDVMAGLKLSAIRILNQSLTNSFSDFNFFSSVGGPITSWSPMAFEWGGRTVTNLWKMAMGDLDSWDFMTKSFALTRQFSPLLDTLKPEFFDRDE